MKQGQPVTYVDAHGLNHTAIIMATVGSGSSGYKTLDLQVPGRPIVVNVPHANDRTEGRGYWVQYGTVVREPAARTPPRVVPPDKRSAPRRLPE